MSEVPIVDVRDGGPVRHAIECRARARAVLDECVRSLPRLAVGMLPVIDGLTRRWLSHCHSEYTAEILTIANELGFPGIWFLHGCCQWACTAVARDQDGAPWLARTPDWAFSGLGPHAMGGPGRGPPGGVS